jgi:hypothetical protein
MEHALILLVEGILAIDRNLQKPVRAVVTDFARLRAEPRAVLADGEIIVGPRKAYAVATVIGILVGCVAIAGFALGAIDRPRNRPVENWYIVAAGLGALISGAATTALVLRWLRGGSAVIQPQGVEFIYRGRSVFCPWTLFQAAGSPYQPDHKRVILPVNDRIPVALTDADGNVTARPAEEVKTKPVTGGAEGQVALHDLYEVKLLELGELLLHLGRQLGDGDNTAATYGRPAARPASSGGGPMLAAAQPGGWLRIRLTRLPFPPVCLGCGAFTRESISHGLDVRNSVKIEVPLCRGCQVERSRRRRRAVLLGLVLGLLPLALALPFGVKLLAPDDLIILCLILGLVGLFLGLIGGFIARDRADPARFKEYSASAGTVLMKLRPSPGAEAFRDALGLDPEPEPAAASA